MGGLLAKLEAMGPLRGMLYASLMLLSLPFLCVRWGYRQALAARQRRQGWSRAE